MKQWNRTTVNRIQETYPGMTRAQKKIARFVLRHPVEVLTMSLDGLASRTDTSRASVLRFCGKLAFDGFRELRQKMAEETVRPQDDSMLSWCMATSEQCVRDTFAALDRQQFKKAVNRCAGARRLVWYGIAESGFLAEIGNHKCMHLGIDAVCSREENHFLDLMSGLSSDDAVVIISQSGKGIHAETVANYLRVPVERCRAQDVYTVGISSDRLSWLSRHVDDGFFAQSKCIRANGNPVVIKAGFEALVSTLAVEIGRFQGVHLTIDGDG